MTKAPERIWVTGKKGFCSRWNDHPEDGYHSHVEYIRSDIHAELVKAADELAAAVDAEHNMVCQDFGIQLEAYNRVCDALTAYKQAKDKLNG